MSDERRNDQQRWQELAACAGPGALILRDPAWELTNSVAYIVLLTLEAIAQTGSAEAAATEA